MKTVTKSTNELKVGDTIEVWWQPKRDTIVSLVDYTGPLECVKGGKLAEFALNKSGMSMCPGDEFKVIAP